MSAAKGWMAKPSIERITVEEVAYPPGKPMRSGIHSISEIHSVIATIHVGDVTGIGYTFAFRQAEAAAVREIVTFLGRSLVGRDVDGVRELVADMWREVNFTGPDGVATMAVSCLDIAMWDARARRLGVPLCRLVGGVPKPCLMYGSGGSLSLPVEALVEEALDFRDRGYVAYKFRVGSTDLEDDVARAEAVRAAVGGTFALAVDANQAWSRPEAAAAIVRLSSMKPIWVEEPLAADDLTGLVALRRRSSVRIAAGETLYGSKGLAELVRLEAVDILQPDLMRCGGVTGLLAVGAIADVGRVAVYPHLYSEVNSHLLAALPNTTWIEHLEGWFEHLFVGGPVRLNGTITPTEDPGLGMTVDSETIRRHSVASLEL